jgi:predicted CoA-binding protein
MILYVQEWIMSNNSEHHVVVLGASSKEERYSNKAVKQLLEHGYRVTPVNPTGIEVYGLACVRDLASVSGPVDTLTMYVGPDRSAAMANAILALQPERIIFNPGSDNPELAKQCAANDILVINACTLVLLGTGQF